MLDWFDFAFETFGSQAADSQQQKQPLSKHIQIRDVAKDKQTREYLQTIRITTYWKTNYIVNKAHVQTDSFECENKYVN